MSANCGKISVNNMKSGFGSLMDLNLRNEAKGKVVIKKSKLSAQNGLLKGEKKMIEGMENPKQTSHLEDLIKVENKILETFKFTGMEKNLQKECLINCFKVLESCLLNLSMMMELLWKNMEKKEIVKIVKKSKRRKLNIVKGESFAFGKKLSLSIVKGTSFVLESEGKEINEETKKELVKNGKISKTQKYKDWISEDEWRRWPWFDRVMRRWNFSDSHQCLPEWEEKKLSSWQRKEFHNRKWCWLKGRLQKLLDKPNKVQLNKVLVGIHSRVLDGKVYSDLDKSFEEDIGFNVGEFVKRKLSERKW